MVKCHLLKAFTFALIFLFDSASQKAIENVTHPSYYISPLQPWLFVESLRIVYFRLLHLYAYAIQI